MTVYSNIPRATAERKRAQDLPSSRPVPPIISRAAVANSAARWKASRIGSRSTSVACPLASQNPDYANINMPTKMENQAAKRNFFLDDRFPHAKRSLWRINLCRSLPRAASGKPGSQVRTVIRFWSSELRNPTIAIRSLDIDRHGAQYHDQ